MPTPNTVLMTTAMIATFTERVRAWTTSGSSRMARRSAVPSAKAFLATSHTGQATSSTR